MNKLSNTITAGRLLFSIYLVAWLSLVLENIGQLSSDQLVSVFGNALVIALFVGLGININAFVMRNRQQTILTLRQRLEYIKENLTNVITFFAIPFCVSSASSIVISNSGKSLINELFGTESHLLIIAVGFAIFIALPAALIAWRYGWDCEPHAS